MQEKDIKEAPGAMLVPMIFLAAVCLLFGLWNSIPLSAIQPLVYSHMGGIDYSGWPHTINLVLISVSVLLLSIVNHYIGYRRTGEGLLAVEHIHRLPILHQIYNGAEKRYFDPYVIFMQITRFVSYVFYCVDRSINWIYDVLMVKVVSGTAATMRNFNNGSTSRYIYWALTGIVFLLLIFILLYQEGVK